MSNFLIEKILLREQERWAETAGSGEITLLRLMILRQLVQELHSEKSRCLATGLKDEAQAIKTWETKIEELRESVSLKDDLLTLINNSGTVAKKKRLLPEGLFQSLDRTKLLRYDRIWEAAIAAEAISHNWSLWVLDTWVTIDSIQEWEKELGHALWPNGLILFAESSPLMYTSQQLRQPQDIDHPYWRGNWNILLHPYYRFASELALNLEKWPNAPAHPPSPLLGNGSTPKKVQPVRLVDFSIKLLEAQAKTLQRLAAFFGEDALFEVLENAGEKFDLNPTKIELQREWFEYPKLTKLKPGGYEQFYSELEIAVRDFKLPPVLEFHLWAYPFYRAIIESSLDLNLKLRPFPSHASEHLVDAAVSYANTWYKSLGVPHVVGAAAEQAALVPWIRFRSEVLKMTGKRPISPVQE